MDSVLLQELETIRAYVFIIMVAIVLWAILKALESSQRIFTGFKKTWDTYFENKLSNLTDKGEYEKVLQLCDEVLISYPNHIDAVWYKAKAHYYIQDNELAKKYFEKAVYLVPSWEESAKIYLEKLDER